MVNQRLKCKGGWKPPSQGRYKINMDAAIDKVGNLVGIGIVIRDVQGFVVSASSQRISATYSPQVPEAIAIYQGLLLA
ncbi:hypothetical protein Dsin_012261 [Dipteronia sinensis]|uniref:RNase H type-1 domain-containing protein n=1 Tax=Dipteronia sinensis TaxID=43782 RepID=A0AAE0AHQ5_9ROSI|nr:hypothetical protein Dsin_012261 [Dipteronia sinensis]